MGGGDQRVCVWHSGGGRGGRRGRTGRGWEVVGVRGVWQCGGCVYTGYRIKDGPEGWGWLSWVVGKGSVEGMCGKQQWLSHSRASAQSPCRT